MAEEQSWLPETVRNILERSESHYRSVNFKRCAHHMKAALDAVSAGEPLSADFYDRYVQLLKDDCREFLAGFGFEPKITDLFTKSMLRSIDLVAQALGEFDRTGKTPTFSGATSRREDVEAINAYLSAHGGLFDPMKVSEDPLKVLEAVDPFYEAVHDHVLLPGRNYLIVQMELAAGHDRMLQVADEILSVEKAIRDKGEVYSDFRYAFENPGDLTESGEWQIAEGYSVPVSYFARWPLFMYYKVPIITAMVPVHNVIFFSLVQENVAKQKAAGVQSRH
ncbi:MAG: hypothetical protein J5897_03360 [Candidatus Methanomethylophilus sp.]|nr:hypothetical protein [Methanomethylophilus sp.]